MQYIFEAISRIGNAGWLISLGDLPHLFLDQINNEEFD